MLIRYLLVFYFSSFVVTIADRCFQHDFCSNSSPFVSSPSLYNDEIDLRSRNCFCDDRCEQFDDCCDRKRRLTSQSTLKCIDYLSPMLDKKILSFSPLPVRMKTNCLEIYQNSFVDHQCRNVRKEIFNENPFVFIPVTSEQTNITYRNYFCALCNNDDEQTVFWSLKMFCSKWKIFDERILVNNVDQMKLLTSNSTKNCLKTLMYPHENETLKPLIYLRPCKNLHRSRCPSSTPIELVVNCSTGPLAYRYNIRTFRVYENDFCAKCHGENLTELTCVDPVLRSAMPIVSQLRVQPLEILFNPKILRNLSHFTTNPCVKTNRFDDLFFRKCSTKLDENCFYPVVTKENSTMRKYSNGSLLLVDHQSIVLHRNQYATIDENQILFCADRWLKLPIDFPFYRHVVSLIFSSISLICLLIFFIGFYLNSSLHNLPGRSLLCLSLSIFLGQTIFLVASNFSPKTFFCFLSALLLHYFYLSSFFWLFIIARQISSTFQRQTIAENRDKSAEYRRLLRWNLFVFTSTISIVSISLGFQWFFPQSKFSPNYAVVFCSLSNPTAMMIFFLLPIASILGVISIDFIRTISFIHRSKMIAAVSRLDSTTKKINFLFVYIRLAFLMGLQWIFLVIALIFQRKFVWLIFDLINSLPGFFLCFGFFFSPRLWLKIKKNFSPFQ